MGKKNDETPLCDMFSGSGRHPTIGIYQGLPRDALQPQLPCPFEERCEIEKLYIQMRRLCGKGFLSVASAVNFLCRLAEEKEAIEKDLPCLERLRRAAALNRVARIWNRSRAAEEVMAHFAYTEEGGGTSYQGSPSVPELP